MGRESGGGAKAAPPGKLIGAGVYKGWSETSYGGNFQRSGGGRLATVSYSGKTARKQFRVRIKGPKVDKTAYFTTSQRAVSAGNLWVDKGQVEKKFGT